MLGLTFKENVPDLRNTRATDVVNYLKGFGARISVWESLVDTEFIGKKFGLETLTYEAASDIDAVILMNGHDEFKAIRLDELKSKVRTPVLVDVKNFFPRDKARELGFDYTSL